MIFLPFDGFSIKWLVNFIQQVSLAYFVTNLIFAHFALVLILIDHSCWSLDNLVLSVKRLSHFSDDHERGNHFHDVRMTKHLKEVIEKSMKAMEWKETAQEYLKFLILLEFSLLSFIICGCSYTILTDPSASPFAYNALPVMLSQLFIFCLCGTRVLKRFEQLFFQIYEVKWYLMNKKLRKGIQLILVMAQNMKAYNGIFYEMNMDTFIKVWQ